MEYLPNGNLSKYMKKRNKIPESEAAFFGAEIIKILEVLHSNGIIHRDLKPENLVLDFNNHLKIIDFGTS